MVDRSFKVAIERSRIYWDYYRSMYTMFSLAIIAGMICSAIIYTKGEITLTIAVGTIGLLFLVIIFLSALMSLTVWRHENKHLDELVIVDDGGASEPPLGEPLV
jgi:hypothetical protein